MIALANAMAVDHGPDGIRANDVFPGPVDTLMVYARGMTERARETRRKAFVLGRAATRWNIGAAVRFLLSDQACYNYTAAAFSRARSRGVTKSMNARSLSGRRAWPL